MKLSSLIQKELIITKAAVESREQAVELALRGLFDRKKMKLSKDAVKSEIEARDRLGGTVFESGLAIPHARIKDYGDLSIMICIPEKPVPTEGIEVGCFVIMVTSLAVSSLYLQVLATLAKLSNDRDFFDRLKDAASVDEVKGLLSGIYVKKEMTVEDIMSRDYAALKPEMNLKDATDLFYQKKTSYLPVVTADHKFLGELRINDLISVGIPDYAVMIGNLDFLNTFAPFERLLIEEENITVGSVMKQSLVSLSPDTSIVEAALKMTQGNYRHLPVIRNGELAGILNIMDILNKVLRS